jgi:hypothetical protein
MAVASPCWTNLLVYYIEGDKGHLFQEVVGQQQRRVRVRGTAVSFSMPWEDIVRDLQDNLTDAALLEIPRPAECLKYAVRLHLRVGFVDFAKQLKQ